MDVVSGRGACSLLLFDFDLHISVLILLCFAACGFVYTSQAVSNAERTIPEYFTLDLVLLPALYTSSPPVSFRSSTEFGSTRCQSGDLMLLKYRPCLELGAITLEALYSMLK